MKQKDFIIIIATIFVSGIASFIISGKLVSTPANRQEKVDVVPVINTEFSQPSSKYFNSSSIDPTQLIQIGTNSNQTPFNTQTSQ